MQLIGGKNRSNALSAVMADAMMSGRTVVDHRSLLLLLLLLRQRRQLMAFPR
jgi:hypothetical protein